MKIIDLHQDIYLHIRYREEVGQSHQTDFSMIAESNIDLSFATAFPYPPKERWNDPVTNELITEELQMYKDYISKNSGWKLIQSKKELDLSDKKLILHLEGLNAFSGNIEDWQLLATWYEMGVRSIGTHWNVDNQLGGGTLSPEKQLTDLGREVINWIEDKGLILDFAHMGRHTFHDAAKVVNRPILVTHGNVDALCPDVRNYTDEQLKLIAESGGLIGVFFASDFVAGKNRVSTLDHVVAHMTYIKSLIGVQYLGIGSDFGGILSHDIENLASVKDFDNLFPALAAAGFTENEIEDIAYNNSRRVINSLLN